MKSTLKFLSLSLVIILSCLPGYAQVITTFAGNGTAGSAGDGSPATNAQLSNTYGVASDLFGNIYIADLGTSRVRKVSAAGTMSLFAGGGTGGDGGPAVSAVLSGVSGVAVDPSGNVYISESSANRVRKVNTSGIISTYSAIISSPAGLACDAAGNLYVASQGNYRVFKISPIGTITPFAGTGAMGTATDGVAATSSNLFSMSGVACDAAGNVYICSYNDRTVRVVNTAGIMTSFAGNGGYGSTGDGGPATDATLTQPYGLSCDPAGNLYIADIGAYKVRKVNTATNIISTVAGTGTAGGTAGYNGENIPALSSNISPYHFASIPLVL